LKQLIALAMSLSIITTFVSNVKASVKESKARKIVATTKKYSKAIIYSTIGFATFALGTISTFSSLNSYFTSKKYFNLYLRYMESKKHCAHFTSIVLNRSNQKKIMSILKAQFSCVAFLTSLYAFTNTYNAIKL